MRGPLPERSGPLDPWLERAIHADDGEPGFVGDGLAPCAFFALRCLGSEIGIVGSVFVLLYALRLAADGRERLTGLELTADARFFLGLQDETALPFGGQWLQLRESSAPLFRLIVLQ